MTALTCANPIAGEEPVGWVERIHIFENTYRFEGRAKPNTIASFGCICWVPLRQPKLQL